MANTPTMLLLLRNMCSPSKAHIPITIVSYKCCCVNFYLLNDFLGFRLSASVARCPKSDRDRGKLPE
jgi:hypothetical protein